MERAEAITVGFNRQADIDMGPLIDASAWQRVDRLVTEAVRDGARLLTGGGRPEGVPTGSFYAPTVLADVTASMRVYREEIFGPVVSLIEFGDEADVLRQANDTEAGLTAYLFTRDLHKADRCAARLRFGEVQINGAEYAIDLPHGGIKQSGVGCDCSYLALHDYLAPKRVSRALAV